MAVVLNPQAFKNLEDIISFPLPRLKNPLVALLFPTPLNSIIYSVGRAFQTFIARINLADFGAMETGKPADKDE